MCIYPKVSFEMYVLNCVKLSEVCEDKDLGVIIQKYELFYASIWITKVTFEVTRGLKSNNVSHHDITWKLANRSWTLWILHSWG
jgi:hypothetical protein